MDPVSALGLVANVVQFVIWGVQFAKSAREVNKSGDGVAKSNKTWGETVLEVEVFSNKLIPPEHSQLIGDEKALCDLAVMCQDLSNNVLSFLDKIKPNDPTSKRQVVWALLKAKHYEPDILKLQKSLDICQAQLNTQLTWMTRKETKEKLVVLLNSAEKNDTRLINLQKQIATLNKGVDVSNLSPKVQNQISALMEMSASALASIKQQRIKKSVSFDIIHQRWDGIEEAHDKTISWIYDKDEYPDDDLDDEKRLARKCLSDWLSSGTGLFHISGKFGSGKSTLMKYLRNQEQTKRLLGTWSDKSRLIIAKHFFWKAGSPIQRSLEGLHRTLLYEIFCECPELIPVAFPDHWEQMGSTTSPWQLQEGFHFSANEISAAFTRITCLENFENLNQRYSFFFFIDALDEFEGTKQKDTKYLLDELKIWTKAPPGNIKICVSSRDYNLYTESLKDSCQILMQKLNKQDIKTYVMAQLECINNQAEKDDITGTIIEKADGVFLWVVLAVRMIREQLNDSPDLITLKEDLESLPEELGELFDHILTSLTESNLRKAYQTFLITERLNSEQHFNYDEIRKVFSPLSLSFLDEYNRDPKFAEKEEFPIPPAKTSQDRENRIDIAQKRLNGYCKGLIEFATGGPPRFHPDKDTIKIYYLTFAHRSVFDFLKKSEMKHKMLEKLGDFTAEDAISQLCLAELRYRQFEDLQTEWIPFIFYQICCMRRIAGLDEAPYKYLECLTSIARHFKPNIVSQEESSDADIFLQQSENTRAIVGNTGNTDELKGLVIQSPILIAAYAGIYEFSRSQVEKNLAEFNQLDLEILFYTLVDSLKEEGDYAGMETSGYIPWLLQHGLNLQSKDVNSVSYEGSKPTFRERRLSIWEDFAILTIESAVTGKDDDTYLIEKLLESEVDPYLWIGEVDAESKRMTLKVGQEQSSLSVECKWDVSECSNSWTGLSFRDIIIRWNPKNKDRILDLIDRNSVRLQKAAQINEQIPFDRGNKPHNSHLEKPAVEEVSLIEHKKASEHQLSHPINKSNWFALNIEPTHVAAVAIGFLLALTLNRLITVAYPRNS